MRVRQAALLLALLLAACGASSHPSSSTAPAPPSSSSVTVTAASSSSPPASTSASTTSTITKDTNVRLPATFTIHAGGILTPPSIAAPKHTDIALTVSSGDGKPHTLVLETPHRYVVAVKPGTPARALLKQLRNGSYAIEVDGVRRGMLVVGAVPGP